MRSGCLRTLILALIASAFVASPSWAQTISTFDTSDEGWKIVGDNYSSWIPSGGNPFGCLAVNDAATGGHNRAAAAAKFLGDWSSLDASDTLSFDIYFWNSSGGPVVAPTWLFHISGPRGDAYSMGNGGLPPEQVWVRYAVSLDSLDWYVDTGDWSSILSDVDMVLFNVEFVDGDEIVNIDNGYLSTPADPLFIPCRASGFNSPGLDGWSYQDTGPVSNPEDDGNGGGYMKVRDKPGVHSYISAPSRFLGDWTNLDGNGYVTVDVRIVQRFGNNIGAPEFIRLQGPGGVAHVSLDAADLPVGNHAWKTFQFPLEASSWTIVSGTWSGLMNYVSECRIDAEYFDASGEIIGIDNFGRMLNYCPPIDAPVTVQSTDISLCDTHSLVDAGGLALNPLDGKLYAAARNTDGNGGGVYVPTGSDAGTLVRGYDRPAGLLFDDDGDGFVSENYDGVVNRFVGSASTSVWASSFGGSDDDDPYGMAFAPLGFNGTNVSAGDVLVVDHGSGGADEIWAFSPDAAGGERLVKADPGDVDWFDLTTDHMSRVWVVDALDQDNLFRLHPDGSFTNLALDTAIPGMIGIVHDSAEDMFYVTSADSQALYRVNPAGGVVTLMADGFEGMEPANLELSETLRLLWVGDKGGERIYEFCLSGVTTVEPGPGIVDFIAVRAAPNPFSGRTELSFRLPMRSDVELVVFDAAGRRVRTLLQGDMAPGVHTCAWDGLRDNGARARPGVYFLRLQSDRGASASHVTLLN